MKYRRRTRFPFFPLIPIAAILLFGLVVMLLWNGIFPQVLHVAPVNYWQAIGILILCRILFCGFRRPQFNSKREWRGGPPWRNKWMNMSEEEKGKFREEWKKRCNPPDKQAE